MILDDIYGSDPDYLALTEDEKARFRVAMSDPETSIEFLSQDSDFLELSMPEKEEFINRLHAENPANYQTSQRWMAKAAQDNPTFLSTIGDSVVASFGKSTAGVWNTLMGGESEAGSMLADDANERLQRIEAYKAQAGTGTNIAHSIISNIATQGPGILASVKLKLPAIALSQLGLLSFGTASEEAREAGYDEGGAIFRGATQAAGEVAAGSITLGALLKTLPTTKKYLLDAIFASVASNVPAEVSHRLRDYGMDALRIAGTKKLAPDTENMSITDFLFDIGGIAGSTAITSAGTGLFYSGTTALSLRMQGLALRNIPNAKGDTLTVAVPTTVPEGFTAQNVATNIEQALEDISSEGFADNSEAQLEFMRRFEIYNIADKIAESLKNPAVESAAALNSMNKDGTQEPLFLGRRAKSADINTLSLAEAMKTKGGTQKEIFESTGWYEIVPGQWAFELDTSGFKHVLSRKGGKDTKVLQGPRLVPVKEFSLAEIFEYTNDEGKASIERLAQSYPELNNVRVLVGSNKTNENQLLGNRNIQGWAYDNTIAIRLENRSTEDITQTLVHEIQHVIQDIEGNERGGNPGREGSFELYQRLTGEAEARLAARRQNAEERKNFTPAESLANMLHEEGYTNPKSGKFVSENVSDVLRQKKMIGPPRTPTNPGQPTTPRPPMPITPPHSPGVRVSVSPEYFKTSPQLGAYGVEGVVKGVRTRDDGVPVYTVEVSEKVDGISVGSEVDTTLVDVPHNQVYPSMLDWRESKHLGRESSKVINFLHNMITSQSKGKSMSDMTIGEIKQSLMGILRVSDNLRVKGEPAWGAYTSQRKGREFIRIAADAGAVDPRFVSLVSAHEIGHFLHLTRVTSDTAKDGMGQILNFDRTMADFIANNPSMFPQDVVDYFKTPHINKAKDEQIFENLFGQELSAVGRAWSLLHTEDASFNEKVADFFSVMLNNPVNEDGSPVVDLVKLAPKMVGVWERMLMKNENMQEAWAKIDEEFSADDMFKRADTSRKAIADKLMADKGFKTRFMIEVIDSNYALWSFFHDINLGQPIVDNLREQIARDGQMQLAEEKFYINPVSEILNELPTQDKRNLEKYAFLNRILFDRSRAQEFMSPDSEERFQAVAAVIRKDMKDQGASDKEIEMALKDARKDHVITRIVELLNPGGVTQDDAQVQLAELKKEMGAERFEHMQDVFKRFSDFRRNWLVENMRTEGYEGDLTHVASNENYVRFAVAHWLTDKVFTGESAMTGLREQKGTLSDIYSPIGATMINDLSIVRGVRKNHIKKQVTALLRASGVDGVIRKVNRNAQINSATHVPISVRESDGSISHYHVDSAIGAGFYTDPAMIKTYSFWNRIVTLGMPGMDASLRRLFTTHNPVFWMNNLIRDTTRSMLNVKGGWRESMKIPVFWASSMAEAWRSLHGGDNTPTVDTMVKQGLLATVNRYIGGELGVEATMADRVMFSKLQDVNIVERDLGDLATFSQKAKIGFEKAVKWWDALGATSEQASKLAAYKLAMGQVKEGKLSLMEAHNFVRRHAGTPILTTKGKAALPLSNLFYFFNPRVQGLIGDYDAWTRGDWSIPFKRVSFAASAAILPMLGLSGAMGDEWKRFWQKIPLYHLLRGPIIPLGETAEGKAVYFIYPVDSLTSFFHASTMNFLSMAFDGDRHESADVLERLRQTTNSVINGVYADIPSYNPRWRLLMELSNLYMGAGAAPTTIFGRPVVPEHIADEGETSLRFQKRVIEHTWNTLGGAFVYRFPYPSANPKLKRTPETTREHIWRMLEQASGVPLVQTLANRIQISDAGLYERQGQREAAQRMHRAKDRNDMMDVVKMNLEGYEGNSLDQISQLIHTIQRDSPEAWAAHMEHLRQNPSEVNYLSNRLVALGKEAYLLNKHPSLAQQFKLLNSSTGNERNRATLEMLETLRKLSRVD